jgi:1-deoxy-D-xylulose-5-phosphate reductoisomerase
VTPATESPANILRDVLSRRVSILGSTGSIGVSTLDVIAHARTQYGEDVLPLEALTAQANVEALAAQAKKFCPRVAIVSDEKRYGALKQALAGTGIEVAAGSEAVRDAASRNSDAVMVAIVGAAALEPALAAVARGATIALANKECVVAAGDIFRKALKSSRATVVPVDSEHNAAFQVLDFAQSHAVERLTLTASGGPFRQWSRERMQAATPEEAVAHPNWSMGAKISVDSATLMNKGLEIIEAHFLFALDGERLGVIVHPQSIVHCLVSYADGSTLAHLSAPDMRTPIAYALAWPRRMASPSNRLDLARVKQLSFEEPDTNRFPCLALAERCLRLGGSAPTILNAANEIAVQAFLNRRIGFLDIAAVIEETLLSNHNAQPGQASDLRDVLEIDARARHTADALCRRLAA